MTPFLLISSEIERVTGNPVDGHDAFCPAHERNGEHKPSLSISEGKDGRVLLRCHAGCSFSDIMLALGLDETDAFPEKRQNGLGEIVATYDYTDEGGTLLYQAVRFAPKNFRQRKPNGNGGYEWSLNGTRRVLYRLQKVRKAAQAGRSVIVVEGEKDAEALERLRFTTTTNAGGAGKWRDEYSEPLRGAHVVILPDNDEVGRKHADDVARSVYGKAASVRIVELPGLPEKGDVSDWLASGGTKEELQRLAKETALYEPKAPISPSEQNGDASTFQNTDLGNAERFIHEHGEDLRYCYPWKSWLSRVPERWARDVTGAVDRLAYDLVRQMQREAVQVGDDDARSSAMKWARSSQGATKIHSMITLAQSLAPVLPEELDADPMLLNTPNGTLDLRTGDLHPHRKSDLITKLSPVSFDPDARCPRWKRHLLEVFDGDEDLIRYLQRNAGYSMTGDVSEQVLTIPYGPGANGKGTTVNTIMYVLGDYAQSTRPELLLARPATGGPSPGEAALKGARFVSTSESGSGHKFDEATVKRLTGGDRIRARFNHQDEFEFDPTHKLWFSTNHRPVIEGTDYAIWRRIHLVPFTVTFSEDRRERNLEQILRREAPGILNWMLKGCLAWQREGLNPPPAVQKATAAYRSEMDVLAAFLDECCETGIAQMQVTAGRLYSEYSSWCERTGEKPETKRGFGLRMTERGYERERKRDGIYYTGIGLTSNDYRSQGVNHDEYETAVF